MIFDFIFSSFLLFKFLIIFKLTQKSIAKECAEHSCFYGFGTTHADSEDLEKDINQILSLGLHGVKLHPDFQKFNADSPEAFKIYELMGEELPLLIHCGDARYDFSALPPPPVHS